MFYYVLICKTIELGVLCFYHDCILASVVIMTLSGNLQRVKHIVK